MAGQNEMLTKAEDIADKVSTVTKVMILLGLKGFILRELTDILIPGYKAFKTRPPSYRQILPCVHIF